MFKLTAKVTFFSEKTWTFRKINACYLERNVDSVTASCRILLPRKLKWYGETNIPLRRGDRVEVHLGYDGNIYQIFTGRIRSVGIKTPVEITCDDLMFDLKTTPAKKNPTTNQLCKL